ncbi:hypothetical protein BACCAP_04520 [Pseudoflavonifractor capillosus ATCC 29799]|uniref:Uncharacterized protein n=1 Tax=Pseudoflavonifractor capillosus ATCC 29799 TaxID=411467 RepID=A6P1Z0_9FIRM|nr:hypothetical protein BACCAP_04520 [Pseudoflavonifractor capillosus ATCC 29799]
MNHPLSILTEGVIQNRPAYWTNTMQNWFPNDGKRDISKPDGFVDVCQ